MAETARVKISESSVKEISDTTKLTSNAASIRVSPNNYFVAFFIATFFIGFLIYLEKDTAAITLFVASWVLIPILAWTDRIVFDGESLYRTGIVSKLWAILNQTPPKLKLSQIDQIETQALRALKRGGNIFYRYRTTVHGKKMRFIFASGGEDYRRMVKNLFNLLSAETLDNRSIELRDYLDDPKEVLMKAEFARIPSSDVLENSLNEFRDVNRNLRAHQIKEELSDETTEKSDQLRKIANELRLSGNLLQSLEAFRRALLLNASNAWLIFEFARCLHSYAGAEHNKKLRRKAEAAMRLSELRGQKDSELLSRIGESYFQYGDWERARKVFNKSLIVAEENFRSVRGLAEIALREGKIAHVIHHFSTAGHFAETIALKQWAHGETEYFSRLNNDEDYMESEIKRINWLENIERGKRISLRIAVASIVTVAVGLIIDDTIANIGWACSSVSILIWAGLIVSGNLMTERSPIVEVAE